MLICLVYLHLLIISFRRYFTPLVALPPHAHAAIVMPSSDDAAPCYHLRDAQMRRFYRCYADV